MNKERISSNKIPWKNLERCTKRNKTVYNRSSNNNPPFHFLILHLHLLANQFICWPNGSCKHWVVSVATAADSETQTSAETLAALLLCCLLSVVQRARKELLKSTVEVGRAFLALFFLGSLKAQFLTNLIYYNDPSYRLVTRSYKGKNIREKKLRPTVLKIWVYDPPVGHDTVFGGSQN